MAEERKHYQLNKKQLYQLKLVYKFRFITIDLLAQYLGVHYDTARDSLNLLYTQGYLGKRYQKGYRFQGKGARYYLTTQSIRLFRAQKTYNEDVLHVMYNNTRVSEPYVDHYIDVARVYLTITKQYPDTFDIFASSEVKAITQLDDLQPDLYLRGKQKVKNPSFLLDVFEDKENFVLKKRLRAYIEHYEEGFWDEEEYPVILLVCPSGNKEQFMLSHIKEVLESTGIDDEITFLVTTRQSLVSEGSIQKVWTNTAKPELPVALL